MLKVMAAKIPKSLGAAQQARFGRSDVLFEWADAEMPRRPLILVVMC